MEYYHHKIFTNPINYCNLHQTTINCNTYEIGGYQGHMYRRGSQGRVSRLLLHLRHLASSRLFFHAPQSPKIPFILIRSLISNISVSRSAAKSAWAVKLRFGPHALFAHALFDDRTLRFSERLDRHKIVSAFTLKKLLQPLRRGTIRWTIQWVFQVRLSSELSFCTNHEARKVCACFGDVAVVNRFLFNPNLHV